MNRLVVVEARGTPRFVDRLRRAWDEGDAVLPLDPRLPPAARAKVLTAARPDEPVDDGDALVVVTSGTTGPPKAVVLTHDAVKASGRATSERLAVDADRDRWLACLPLAHVGGLGVVTRAVETGVALTVTEGTDATTLSRTARRQGCTLVSLVPTLLARIDPTVFRTILLGGSAMPPDLPPNAVTTYGMTETGGGVVYDGTPLDGVELRVVDETVGKEGGIEVRGPMLLRTYRDGTDPKDADGWFPTGDAGRWDPDAGRLRVSGRIGDLIITGGENVWPVVVEEALVSHAEVVEAVVFGREDPEWGQRVVAQVVPRDHSLPPTLDQLRDHVKATLPAWAAPRELELTGALARTPLGKLVRRS